MTTSGLFLTFIIYAFLGWIVEVLYVGLITEKKFYNRGFLHLPIIPLYGFGALLIVLSSNLISGNIIIKLITIIIVTTALEYITALIMDNLFHIKWWDYSNYKFNIKGRVCLRNSVLFGSGGLIILMVHPFIKDFLNEANSSFVTSVEVLMLLAIIVDVYITLKKLTKIEIRDIRYFSQGKVLLPKYEYDIKHIREIFVKNLLEAIFGLNIIPFVVLLILTKDIVLSLSLSIFIVGITYIIVYGYIKKMRIKK